MNNDKISEEIDYLKKALNKQSLQIESLQNKQSDIVIKVTSRQLKTLILAAVFVPLTVYAAGETEKLGLTIFASGETISSADVNENFSRLEARSWDLDGSTLTYDGNARVNALVFADGSQQTTAGIGSANTLSNDADVIINGDSIANSTGGVRLQTKGTDHMYVANSGNVGIGTGLSEPASELEVNGTITATAFSGDGSGLTNLGTNLGKWSDATGGINYAGGNVGIGTTSPTARLHIASDLSLVNAQNGQIILSEATNPDQRLLLGFDSDGDYGAIQAAEAGVGFLPLVLNEYGGNVGIGTANPNYALTVDLGAATNSKELSVQSSGNEASIGLRNSNTAGRSFQLISTGGSSSIGAGLFAIHDVTGNGTRLVIDSLGRVGVGTNTPEATLHVSGSLIIENGASKMSIVVADTTCPGGYTELGFSGTTKLCIIEI